MGRLIDADKLEAMTYDDAYSSKCVSISKHIDLYLGSLYSAGIVVRSARRFNSGIMLGMC